MSFTISLVAYIFLYSLFSSVAVRRDAGVRSRLADAWVPRILVKNPEGLTKGSGAAEGAVFALLGFVAGVHILRGSGAFR